MAETGTVNAGQYDFGRPLEGGYGCVLKCVVYECGWDANYGDSVGGTNVISDRVRMKKKFLYIGSSHIEAEQF